MKKIKISTIVAIMLYAILVFGLSSCGSGYNDTEQSKFVVKEIVER